MIFVAKIKDGNIEFDSVYNKARFSEWCKKNEGKDIRIEHLKGKRTLSQNGMYWAWLTIIAKETGNDENDLHRIFKGMFLTPKIVKVGKREFKVSKSTTELTTSEFSDYQTRVAAEAAGLGIHLPTPDEYRQGLVDNL